MDWIKVSEQLPPDGVVVETKVEDDNGCRNEQNLKRRGDLWYLPDDKMYVYYKPTHWRYLSEDQKMIYEFPPPTYQNIPYAEMLGRRCCFMEEPKEKNDCYFYHDEKHMGGSIPTCNYYNKLGYCPCDDCKKYIKRSEVFDMVKERVDNLDKRID